jgi:hypothetical protein
VTVPRVLAAAVVLLLAGCTAGSTPAATPVTSPAALPPGALNPAVSQATIDTTVCVPRWTASIRPPSSYTSALKRRQMAALHLPGVPADYEEDHTLPLSLAGAPRDPSNLRPIPILQARADDVEERRLHTAVCSRRMSLGDAQRAILGWKAAHR